MSTMEINIDSKRNNPLLNRTEVHFTIIHEEEKTPNRDLVRTELADKLNSKKENIIVNYLNPGFGMSKTTGYAKVYSSKDKIKDQERKFILKRNKLGETKKNKPKEEKKTERKPEEVKKEKPIEKADKTEEPKKEEVQPDKKEEKTDETKEKPEEPNKNEDKPEQKEPEKKSDEKNTEDSNKENEKE